MKNNTESCILESRDHIIKQRGIEKKNQWHWNLEMPLQNSLCALPSNWLGFEPASPASRVSAKLGQSARPSRLGCSSRLYLQLSSLSSASVE